MERAWALEDVFSFEKDIQGNMSPKQGTCLLWGHLGSSQFSKIYQDATTSASNSDSMGAEAVSYLTMMFHHGRANSIELAD